MYSMTLNYDDILINGLVEWNGCHTLTFIKLTITKYLMKLFVKHLWQCNGSKDKRCCIVECDCFCFASVRFAVQRSGCGLWPQFFGCFSSYPVHLWCIGSALYSNQTRRPWRIQYSRYQFVSPLVNLGQSLRWPHQPVGLEVLHYTLWR